MLLSGPIASPSLVRITSILLALAGLLVLPSCWVESINGLSEEKLFGPADHDQRFDPAFLGTWEMTMEKCLLTLSVSPRGKAYEWQVTNSGDRCEDKGHVDYYEVGLFQLDDHQFLDLTARSQDKCTMCLAIHWIFLVQKEKDSFVLTPIDSDWLKNAEEQKTVMLATVQDDTDTVTASPKELKAFCRKYADNKEAFKPIPGFTFKKNQSSA